MKKKILASIILLSATPYIAFAAVSTTFFDDLINKSILLLGKLVPLFIAIAVAFFLWGVLQFVSSGDDAEKRKLAQARMIHGVIAIFVMISLWGLIHVLVDVFNFTNTPISPAPLPPTPAP